MTDLVNTSTYGGSGMTTEWLNNMNSSATDEFCLYYKIPIKSDIDTKTFIVDMYKLLSTKYEFVVTYEYLSKNKNSKYGDIVRPNIFIEGEFLFGFDWHNNKWHALQQILITFCNSYWHHLFCDEKYEYINTESDKNISRIFEDMIA